MAEQIQKSKIKKVFLEGLPKKKGIGANKDKIMTDWTNSIGLSFGFQIGDLFGTIQIIDIKKVNGKSKLLLKYNNKQLWMDSGHIFNCKLKNLVGLKTTEYTYNIGDIVETNSGKIEILERLRIPINASNRKNRAEKGYKYKCLIDDNIDTIVESHLKEGKGCNVCSNHKVMKGVNDIATTHPQLIKYFPNGYSQASLYMIGTKQSFYFKCPICKRIKTTKTRPYDIIRNGIESIGCICGNNHSYCEKFFYRMLELLNIKFIKECVFEWLDGRKRYDFYFKLNNKEYIVETDGAFHYIDNNMSGQTAKETKAIDDEKDRLAKEHGIEVIRIDCNFYSLNSTQKFMKIKSNIINCLSYILDLNNIDWNECNIFAIKKYI